ncbi:hypothetical protein [Jonesia quinghaiensis]|uniref:hypothetical protein n=1 Tax=Jonesia quinghaiensis TaxID=262806 RepID=UPI0003FC1A93|nr:hypothetical protein [Jonesia quinghaiensis]
MATRMLVSRRTMLWTGAALLIVIIAVVLMRGFLPTSITIDEVADGSVESVELFEYTYGVISQEVSRTVIDSPDVVPELTRAFVDMPASSFRAAEHELKGRPATAYRFHLANGDNVEVTQVFIDEQNVAVFWPDGSLYTSKWGRPFEGFYDELGTTETVSGEFIPVAALPDQQ